MSEASEVYNRMTIQSLICNTVEQENEEKRSFNAF
jgi:hypothetical protein